MKKNNNWIYVLYYTFNADLLFWIVIENLFLTEVKHFDVFHIVLISLLGFTFSFMSYPLINLIIKKLKNKFCLIIGSLCLISAISLFMICNTVYGFIVGQTLYVSACQFHSVASVMLKNNLKAQGKSDSFIKWQSLGNLGYSIITLIISLCAGIFFNINAYLPIILTLVCSFIGLTFSILYSETKSSENQNDENNNKNILNENNIDVKDDQPSSFKQIIKNKVLVLLFLLNLCAISNYVFMQSKATLVIQYICKDVGIELAKISIIVSAIVFGSRLARVLANSVFPTIYKKMQNKGKIIVILSLLLLFSNIFFILGCNLNINYIMRLVFISVGFYLILFMRDMFLVCQNKIIISNIPEKDQKQSFVLINVSYNIGRLLVNLFALAMLTFTTIYILYIFMLIFTISQLFICTSLSKYLK